MTTHSCSYGQAGDILWGREGFALCDCGREFCSGLVYRADGGSLNPGQRWQPSTHMPADASRIKLEISKDAPVYEPAWTGFYVGVNGGYGWSADDSHVTSGYLNHTDAKSFTTNGGFGGGQIGYNWQPASSAGYKDGPALGHLVFGIEADIQGAGINGSAVVSAPSIGGVTATGKNDLDWFGTVRGRAGYAWGPTLAYFTGGFAFGGVKDTLSSNSFGTIKTLSSSTTDTGYVLGGGIEHLFSPHWSAKVEYQYIDLGSDKLSIGTAPNATATLDAEHKYNTVRLGLNYHFISDYEPLIEPVPSRLELKRRPLPAPFLFLVPGGSELRLLPRLSFLVTSCISAAKLPHDVQQ